MTKAEWTVKARRHLFRQLDVDAGAFDLNAVFGQGVSNV
jgi:hypothetical protein